MHLQKSCLENILGHFCMPQVATQVTVKLPLVSLNQLRIRFPVSVRPIFDEELFIRHLGPRFGVLRRGLGHHFHLTLRNGFEKVRFTVHSLIRIRWLCCRLSLADMNCQESPTTTTGSMQSCRLSESWSRK